VELRNDALLVAHVHDAAVEEHGTRSNKWRMDVCLRIEWK
jgi:hypothetical protein